MQYPPDRPVLEITPEMVRAGASVLYRMETPFAPEEYWAKEVYSAMHAAAPFASEGHPPTKGCVTKPHG